MNKIIKRVVGATAFGAVTLGAFGLGTATEVRTAEPAMIQVQQAPATDALGKEAHAAYKKLRTHGCDADFAGSYIGLVLADAVDLNGSDFLAVDSRIAQGYAHLFDSKGPGCGVTLEDWEKAKKAQGWKNWRSYDGHDNCWALEGDTSMIECYDGFKETT